VQVVLRGEQQQQQQQQPLHEEMHRREWPKETSERSRLRALHWPVRQVQLHLRPQLTRKMVSQEAVGQQSESWLPVHGAQGGQEQRMVLPGVPWANLAPRGALQRRPLRLQLRQLQEKVR